MKSPLSLKLTLMMGAGATLNACSEPPENFSSVAECVRYGKPQGLCQAAYDEALAAHMRSAPTFGSEAECRASLDVDQCLGIKVKGSDGTVKNVIMPLMAGYMIGKSVSEPRRDEETSGGGGSGGSGGGYAYNRAVYHGAPLYRSRAYGGGYWTAADLKNSKSAVSASHTPNVRTMTVIRHGFGGRSVFGGG